MCPSHNLLLLQTTADGCVSKIRLLTPKTEEKKNKKTYQYWDKIAAAFKLLVVVVVVVFYVFKYSRRSAEFGFQKIKSQELRVKDGVTHSGAGLFGR